MKFFDTHCHYNLEPIYSGDPFVFKIKEDSELLKMNWRDHWQKAQQHGITKSMVVGPGVKSSQKAVEIAEAEENLFASVGIHPERANKIIEVKEEVAKITELAKSKKVIAIGEVGLDYFYLDAESADELEIIKNRQKELFIEQIKLANELKLTLILHVRDRGDQAYLETLSILKEYWNFKKPVIFHCVSGPLSYIEKALELPHSYFGFDGNITFKKADDIKEIFKLVQKTDPKRILLETDFPYLAPVPYRGQICEPYMIVTTAEYIAQELGANLEEIYQNSLEAFGIAETSKI